MDNVINWAPGQTIPSGLKEEIDNINDRAKHSTSFCMTIDYNMYKYLSGRINAVMEIISWGKYNKVTVCISKPE